MGLARIDSDTIQRRIVKTARHFGSFDPLRTGLYIPMARSRVEFPAPLLDGAALCR